MEAIAQSDSSGVATVEDRLVDAAAACVERWGLAKTTVDDVARSAGVSRATVYRVVPGGRDALLSLLAQRELARFLRDLRAELATADDLDELLVRAIVSAARHLRDDPLLASMLAHEPEVVLEHLAFDRLDPLLTTTVTFAAPELERFVPPSVAAEVAEWVARLLVSHLVEPHPTIDPASEAHARVLVRTHLLPGIALALADEPARPSAPAATAAVTTPQEHP